MTQRVKCSECDNMILPQTAADNDGLCAPCAKVSPELRTARREYERQLAEGIVFTPSTAELASSSLPSELATGHWQLQPEYYAELNLDSAADAVIAAKAVSRGNVFLITDDGGQLNLGFTERYAVCEYQNQDLGDFRYAYTELNLRQQVSDEHHVSQACPCCGVGMLWYPSRYHMPRDTAFLLLDNAIARRASHSVEWLQMDDISHTGRGCG